MTKCFFCGTKLETKSGKSKIWTQLNNNDIAVVEIDSPLFCCGCKEHYLTTEQIIEGFNQIKAVGDVKSPITKGIYS